MSLTHPSRPFLTCNIRFPLLFKLGTGRKSGRKKINKIMFKNEEKKEKEEKKDKYQKGMRCDFGGQ